MRGRYAAARGKGSQHTAGNRLRPSLLQYDYLTLQTLSESIAELIAQVPAPSPGANAVDLGSSRSPYRPTVEGRGFRLETLDLTHDEGADHVGTVEATGLPDESFELVLCTQVLEHCDDPWRAVGEIRRILAPGGHVILSAPHVWFYHPHPHDHWRFTQEGMVRLCRENGLEPVLLLAQGGTILTAFQVLNFLLYGIAGRWGIPFFAVLNLLGRALDRMLPNELFCHNFACLARHP
jgi:SAM-dependent methyltransferase